MPTMDQPENNIVTVRICTRNNSEKSSKLFLVILSSNCHNRKHDKLHHGNSNPYPTMTLISTYCFMNNHLNSLSVNTHPQLRMEITPNFTYKSTLCDAGTPTHPLLSDCARFISGITFGLLDFILEHTRTDFFKNRAPWVGG